MSDDSYRRMNREWLGINALEERLTEHETSGNHGGGDPGPIPVPVEERVLPMYDPGECQAFIKDYDFSEDERVRRIGGYCRGENVHIWFSAKDLQGNSGPLLIIPNPVQELFRYGGLRAEIEGTAHFWNDDGTDHTIGVANWEQIADGRYALKFRFVDVFPHQANDGKLKTMKVNPDYPFNWQYGVNLRAAITLI